MVYCAYLWFIVPIYGLLCLLVYCKLIENSILLKVIL